MQCMHVYMRAVGWVQVWHETFTFNIINENTVSVVIKDEDTGACP